MLQLHQPVFRRGVVLALQRLPLDLELHDAAVEFVELFRLAVDLHAQPAGGLVDQVDRLVRQVAVGDVAVGQRCGRHQRVVGDAHAVVQFVFLPNATQDADGVFHARFADEHGLEAARQGGVLLDVFPIFVERGGADAMQGAAGQFRLDQVGRVHRALGAAGADQVVQLVDEQDDLALGGLDLLQHGLQPFLELAAELGAGHHGAEIQRHQPLALQRLRHVAIDDADGQAFHDRRLADARLSDQHRIVLGAAGQHLDGAADFLVAADHRIELAFARLGRHVPRVFLQRVEIGLGVLAGDLLALADFRDRLLQRLRHRARAAQRPCGTALAIGQRHQQPVLCDVFVAGFLRRLLRAIENAHQRRGDLRLAGAAALHFRQFREVCFHGSAGGLVVAAGGADQPGGGAFLVVQQGLQQVLRRQLLVEFADSYGLRGLDEPTRAVGEFFYVHVQCPSAGNLGDPAPQQATDPLSLMPDVGNDPGQLKRTQACVSTGCTAIR